MHSENNAPKRRGGGPRGMGAPGEKAKNFKSAIKRLFHELSSFRILIIISLVFAALGSILSIIAPDHLSDLTDEISKGLVVKQENLELVSNTIMGNLSDEKTKGVLPEILDLQLDKDTIMNVMTSSDISASDKQIFQDVLASISSSDSNGSFSNLVNLPEKLLKIVLPDSTYQGVHISTSDKISFLNIMASLQEEKFDVQKLDSFPMNIAEILFPDFSVEPEVITTSDQISFLKIMSTLEKDADASELYACIDKMPESIQNVIKPFMDMDAVCDIALFLAILYILSAVFNYIESISMTDVANKFAKILRRRISVKINRLPLKYFDKHQTGDILSRVTNDVDTIAQSMNQSLSTLVSATTLFVGTIIMMFVTNWIMAITAILASLVGFVFMFMILGKSQKYFVQRQVELGLLNGHIEEIYSGLNVVKAYNGKKDADKKFDELNKRVYDANRKSQFLSGLMMPIMNFIGNFGYVAVCIVGALLTLHDMTTFGVIVAFIMYVRLFTSPLSQIAQALTSLQTTAAASERVFEFLDEEEMSSQQEIKKRLDKSKVRGTIEFEHVMFQYDGNDKPTIQDFNAAAHPGEKIAIVGPTGAGKTTMVNLLMKFYEINSGDIKIDGISTKDLTRENIHELFTMVLQDTWLFQGTVKENIVYNRKNISDEEIEEVCKTVGLNHFIKTLPQGYDTILSDNDSVSAGQKQLLTIARGMMEDAPFLILDEATSNVDTRTEELVQQAMDKLTEGRTSFIIAHRLSTIKNADLILVMKDGNIIEQGNHDTLMAKNGFYAELYNSQFQL